jgi:transposase
MRLVADIMGVHPTTVWRWSKRFKEKGIDGLQDHSKGHNPAKLGSEHRRIIFEWLNKSENAEGDCVHWTIPLLKEEVQKVFGIVMGKTPLWLMVRKLGFRQKIPRPLHAKADREEQEVFKKNG